MKRNSYKIEIQGKNCSLTKFAWNSARKAIPALIKTILEEGQTAKFIKFNSNFKTGVEGSEVWQLSTGELIIITTNKE